MNTLKTVLYMGSTHGFLTFYVPYFIGSHSKMVFDAGIFRLLALPLWITGTFIIIRCSIDMIRRGQGTPAHLDPPKRLVINGLYRHVRNPIYLGALSVHLGTILWFGSGLLIIYCLLFVLGYYLLVLFIEEPILKSTFGREYEAYMKSVPRWLPKLK